MTTFVVTTTTLLNRKVFLNDVGYHRNLSRVFAFAFSRDYHLTGDIPEEFDSDDLFTLAVACDRVVYVYDEDKVSFEAYNLDGTGYFILYRDTNGFYKIVSVHDEKQQHITTFSKYHPLVVSIMKAV